MMIIAKDVVTLLQKCSQEIEPNLLLLAEEGQAMKDVSKPIKKKLKISEIHDSKIHDEDEENVDDENDMDEN
jgi:hypothetical protein